MSKNAKLAFTLAETLITIGIIGVVAAIVIPVTMQKVQDYVFGKAKANSLMKITEATKEMKSNDVLSGYTSNSAFADVFDDYMTVVKRCDSTNLDDCFVDTFKTADGDSVDTSTLTTGTKLSKNNISDNTIAMMLKNGTTVLLSLRDPAKVGTDCDRIDPFDNTSSTTGCMSMLYDINGRSGPNTLGRDIGTVAVTAFTCSGIKISDGTCFQNAFYSSALSYADCNAKKTSLGISACWNPDYWAGAVEQCGGLQHMPTMSQLSQLVEVIYGKENCVAGVCTATLDYAMASKLGINAQWFYVWSNQEISPSYAGYAIFMQNVGQVNVNGTGRNSNFYVFCID